MLHNTSYSTTSSNVSGSYIGENNAKRKNEFWDGTVDINIKIVSNVDIDDMEEEVVQTPHVSQLVIAPSTPMTPQHGSTQGPSTQVETQATPTSTPRAQ